MLIFVRNANYINIELFSVKCSRRTKFLFFYRLKNYMLHYVWGAFMSCNCCSRTTVQGNLSCDYNVSSQRHLVILPNCSFFLKKKKEIWSDFAGVSSRSSCSCRLAAFPRGLWDFDVSRILVIYSNVSKIVGSAGGDILSEITSCLAHPPKLLGKMDLWLHGKKTSRRHFNSMLSWKTLICRVYKFS